MFWFVLHRVGDVEPLLFFIAPLSPLEIFCNFFADEKFLRELWREIKSLFSSRLLGFCLPLGDIHLLNGQIAVGLWVGVRENHYNEENSIKKLTNVLTPPYYTHN